MKIQKLSTKQALLLVKQNDIVEDEINGEVEYLVDEEYGCKTMNANSEIQKIKLITNTSRRIVADVRGKALVDSVPADRHNVSFKGRVTIKLAPHATYDEFIIKEVKLTKFALTD